MKCFGFISLFVTGSEHKANSSNFVKAQISAAVCLTCRYQPVHQRPEFARRRVPRDHLVIADACLAQRFLLHRVARGGAGAGVVARALVFERVDYAAVFVHQREIDAFGIDREERVLVGAGEEFAEAHLCHHLPFRIARNHRLVERLEHLGLRFVEQRARGELGPADDLQLVRRHIGPDRLSPLRRLDLAQPCALFTEPLRIAPLPIRLALRRIGAGDCPLESDADQRADKQHDQQRNGAIQQEIDGFPDAYD